MPREIYMREPGVENCAHAEVCEHACRMGCKAYEPRVDRESLLALADEIETVNCPDYGEWDMTVRRIREALGVQNV